MVRLRLQMPFTAWFNVLTTLFPEFSMTLSPADQNRIIDPESAWLDSNFAGIDLSQFPSLQPLPPETSRDDGRFAKDWRDTPFSASADALRSFVSNPDADAME